MITEEVMNNNKIIISNLLAAFHHLRMNQINHNMLLKSQGIQSKATQL